MHRLVLLTTALGFILLLHETALLSAQVSSDPNVPASEDASAELISRLSALDDLVKGNRALLTALESDSAALQNDQLRHNNALLIDLLQDSRDETAESLHSLDGLSQIVTELKSLTSTVSPSWSSWLSMLLALVIPPVTIIIAARALWYQQKSYHAEIAREARAFKQVAKQFKMEMALHREAIQVQTFLTFSQRYADCCGALPPVLLHGSNDEIASFEFGQLGPLEKTALTNYFNLLWQEYVCRNHINELWGYKVLDRWAKSLEDFARAPAVTEFWEFRSKEYDVEEEFGKQIDRIVRRAKVKRPVEKGVSHRPPSTMTSRTIPDADSEPSLAASPTPSGENEQVSQVDTSAHGSQIAANPADSTEAQVDTADEDAKPASTDVTESPTPPSQRNTSLDNYDSGPLSQPNEDQPE